MRRVIKRVALLLLATAVSPAARGEDARLIRGVALLPPLVHVGSQSASAGGEDARSRVILSSDCRTTSSRRELTLFANGTLRIFDGLGATREMRLAELGRAELEAYVARLRKISFDDLPPGSAGLEGEWVERCRLELRLAGEEPRVLAYGPYDSLPLAWKHVQLLVDDLLEEIRARPEADERVRRYEPEVGDILVRRSDGARYEVLGFTLEGNGVELLGLEEPLPIYILGDHLLDAFDPPTKPDR